jgi:hypothetical protein
MTKPNHVTPSTMLQLVILKLKLPYFSITTIGNRTNTSQNALLLIDLEVLQIHIDNIALSNKSLVDSVPSIRLSCENMFASWASSDNRAIVLDLWRSIASTMKQMIQLLAQKLNCRKLLSMDVTLQHQKLQIQNYGISKFFGHSCGTPKSTKQQNTFRIPP